PKCPSGGFAQALGFSAKVVFGSKQWQFRSTVKNGSPGTRSTLVFWNMNELRLVWATGTLKGKPLAYRITAPRVQSRAAHEATLLAKPDDPANTLGVV